tara:strand:- start:5635 stop:5880 length:246 start_codon:yes stop_codon:yes gene_type:complete
MNKKEEVIQSKFPTKLDKDLKEVLQSNGYEWDYNKNNNSRHGHHIYINKTTNHRIGVSAGTLAENKKSRMVKILEKQITNH